MRRLSFQSQLPAAVDGFAPWDLDAFLWGDWHSDEAGDLSIAVPPSLSSTSSGAGASSRPGSWRTREHAPTGS